MVIAGASDVGVLHRYFEDEEGFAEGTVFKANFDEYFDIVDYLTE